MCTVTFIPDQSGSFFITSNRDEASQRQAIAPEIHTTSSSVQLLYPKDPLAGGSWIATGDNRITCCLLNGAFTKHHHSPPYRKSRGLILLEWTQIGNTNELIHQFNLDGIEPFTILFFDEKITSLNEMRWDGKTLHHQKLDPDKSHILASATLYDEATVQWREKAFTEWFEKQNGIFNVNTIMKFHKTTGKGDSENDFIMHRRMVQTLSVTCIEITPAGKNMIYEDLISQKIHVSSIESSSSGTIHIS